MIIMSIDPLPPPWDIHLADVGQGHLAFEWSPVANNCVSLVYAIDASESCGSCPSHITTTSVSCAFNASHVPGVCRFAVRTIVCDSIIGNWSEPVNATLKGTSLSATTDNLTTTVTGNYTSNGELPIEIVDELVSRATPSIARGKGVW